MQTHKIFLSFKENRDYIQGPDLFNNMLSHFNDKTLSDIYFTIHKQIKNDQGQIYISKNSNELKNLPFVMNATTSLLANEEKYWLAYSFEDENPKEMIHNRYDESILIKL